MLARDVVGTVPVGSDLRRLVRALATDYPDTWTYAVDGLIGASPETLVTVSGGTVTARVLAGTIPRGTDAGDDVAASDTLAHSDENLDEHRYAVRSVLDLVAALHPTAAVAGTPTDAAIEVIRRIEPFDRGRYAGPVGWVDANGDGEWAIALRCAQIGAPPARRFATYSDTIPVVAHAGAGIVAGSDPDAELIETRVKFRPIVDALA
ncbi:isochorismate synthase EntC [Microbacterium ulmi]|nr:isochorismate synthase EntC [Microbacterium ulmi]